MNQTDIDHFIHPDLVTWMSPIQEAYAQILQEGPDAFTDPSIRRLVRHKSFPLHQLVAGVGVCPFLHPDRCTDLAFVADFNASEFSPESSTLSFREYRELIFLDTVLREISKEILFPLFTFLTGRLVLSPPSIELTHCCPGSELRENWTTDPSSEFLAFVGLTRSGGISLRPHGVLGTPFVIPTLPPGHALLFNGRSVFHQQSPSSQDICDLLTIRATNQEVFL